VVDVRWWSCSGLGGYLEECMGLSGLVAWDLIGEKFTQHPQRSCALAWQDVSDSLLYLSLF
jgi:hypothetical protein